MGHTSGYHSAELGLKGIHIAPMNKYTADLGAIAVTDGIAQLSNTGAAIINLTLADGEAGQQMLIHCVDAAFNCVLTPASLGGGTTITFGAAGQYAHLYFDGTAWQVTACTAVVA